MSTSASRRSRASLSPFSFVAPVAAVAAVFACGSLASAALPPGYTIEPLLPPGAQHSVKVIDLLDDGRLGIEVSRTTPNTVGNVDAWTRSPAGTWRSAPIPAGNNQINELGAVAADGTMYGTWRVNNNIFDQRVFVSRPDGTFVDLGRYNNSNSFFGAATEQFVAGRSNRGFLYNVATGTSSPLVPLSGDETQLASPFGSNANGWFVGVSPQAAGSGQTRGTAWIPDGAGSFSSANMGMPAGAPAGVTSTARGVSDNNVAVGYFGTFTSNDGFIWDQASGIRALQRNPASNTSHFAYDVNTDELIVGYRSAAARSRR